jgi:Protein of unknown function (DUF3800)
VRLVYIDEAGISKPTEEPFVVVAGVIAHGDHDLNGIENRLQRIMLRHIPERLREGFVFHATEVFNGGKTLKREKGDFIGPREWPIERRLEIADDIMRTLRQFRLPVAIGFVERASFPQTFDIPQGWSEAERTVAAHASAFMNCAMVAEQWMRRDAPNENCLLIVENNDQAKKIVSDLQRYHQDHAIEALLDERDRGHFPFRKIKEDPLFQPKKASNPLILADFCAYVFKRVLMQDDRYNRFFEIMRPNLIVFDDTWLNRRRGRGARNNQRRSISSARSD